MSKLYKLLFAVMLTLKFSVNSFAAGELTPITYLLLLDEPGPAIYQCKAGLLKDLNGPGSLSSYRVRPQFTELGNLTVFFADHPAYGTEPWVTDGTAAGTKLLKDIRPGALDGIRAGLLSEKKLVRAGDKLFFLADNGFTGQELWITDGTAVGTKLIRNINGNDSSSGITNITAYKNKLYFQVVSGRIGIEDEGLWVSDGTQAGTRLLKDTSAGTGSPSIGEDSMTVLNNTLYFITETGDGASFEELWKSNGTASGTTKVTDIGSTIYQADQMTNVGNKFYFLRNDGPNGNELWVSDGTASGTLALSVFRGGAANIKHEIGTYPENPGYQDKLYFYGYSANQGYELWQSDGTVAGTRIVRDIYPGMEDSAVIGIFYGQEFNGHYYFQADNNINGVELWRINPDFSLTLIDLDSGSGSSSPKYFTANDDYIFFSASYDFYAGDELTLLDKTGRIHQIDLFTGSFRSSAPRDMYVRKDGSLLFTTSNGNFSPGVGLYILNCPEEKINN